jgi:hypothetical protein
MRLKKKTEDSEAYYQLAINEYNRSIEMFHNRREFSAIIVGACSIVIALAGTVITSLKVGEVWKLYFNISMFLALASFLISVLSSFGILWPWWYLEVDPWMTIKAYEQKEWRLEEVAEELFIATNFNRRRLKRLEPLMKVSIISMCIGLIFLVFVVIFFLLGYT